MLNHVKIAIGKSMSSCKTAYVKYSAEDKRDIREIVSDYMHEQQIEAQVRIVESATGKKLYEAIKRTPA